MVHFRSRPEGEASKVRARDQAQESSSPGLGLRCPSNCKRGVSSGSSGATLKPRRAPGPRPSPPGPRPSAPGVRAKEKPRVRGAADREAKARERPQLRPDQP